MYFNCAFWLIDWFQSIIIIYKIHKVFFPPFLDMLKSFGGNDNVDALRWWQLNHSDCRSPISCNFSLSLRPRFIVFLIVVWPILCLADLFNLWKFIRSAHIFIRVCIKMTHHSTESMDLTIYTSRFLKRYEYVDANEDDDETDTKCNKCEGMCSQWTM